MNFSQRKLCAMSFGASSAALRPHTPQWHLAPEGLRGDERVGNHIPRYDPLQVWSDQKKMHAYKDPRTLSWRAMMTVSFAPLASAVSTASTPLAPLPTTTTRLPASCASSSSDECKSVPTYVSFPFFWLTTPSAWVLCECIPSSSSTPDAVLPSSVSCALSPPLSSFSCAFSWLFALRALISSMSGIPGKPTHCGAPHVPTVTMTASNTPSSPSFTTHRAWPCRWGSAPSSAARRTAVTRVERRVRGSRRYSFQMRRISVG